MTAPSIARASGARRPSWSARTASRRVVTERLVLAALWSAAAVSVLTTVGIVGVLIFETVAFFGTVPFSDFAFGTRWAATIAPQSFGVLPLISGTLLVAVIAMAVAMPLGVTIAVYLSEYAPEGLRRAVKPLLEILAGIPTVVYGYFALTFITPHLLRPLWGQDVDVFNALSAGIVVGIMILPMVASMSEDAMSAVPRSLREGAFALGATRLEVSLRVVFPAALSGIIASFILAISRAIGETMAVALAAGSTPNLTIDPRESIQTMTGFIVQLSLGDTPQGSLAFRTIFAVGMTLFAMTLVLNVASQALVRRFREVYQ